MQRIIVSDIFGKTKALETIADCLSGEVSIFHPYTQASKHFESEQQAYDYFVTKVGLQQYSDDLENYLSGFEEPVSLLGFSVGASAIWNISEKLDDKKIVGAVCFYGSQIRHAKNLVPNFPFQLVLPRSEKHFSVTDLKTALLRTENVNIHKSNYLHGFMNRLSDNFNQQGYEQFLRALSNIHIDKSFHTSSF